MLFEQHHTRHIQGKHTETIIIEIVRIQVYVCNRKVIKKLIALLVALSFYDKHAHFVFITPFSKL